MSEDMHDSNNGGGDCDGLPAGEYLTRALKLMEDISMVEKDAVWINAEIDRQVKMDTSMMGWEEREGVYRKDEELYGRLMVSIKTLLELDNEQRTLSRMVNKKYGKEILKITPPLIFPGVNGPMDNEDYGTGFGDDGIDFGSD